MKTFLASLVAGRVGGSGPGTRLNIYRRVLQPSVVSRDWRFEKALV
jgi:hypothetical protein